MLTCKSCTHYRTDGCAQRQTGWPSIALAECWWGVYEPGSDEAEDE